MTEPLNKRTVAAYAMGFGPAALLSLTFTVYLAPFIAKGGMIPIGLVGLLFSITTLWDGIIDPLIGTMIDRKSTGEAPHRRWMRLALPPLLLFLVILVFWADTLGFWILLPILLLFYSSQSLYDVAHLAWGAALAKNPDDSARLFGNRELAAKIILVAAVAMPAIIQAFDPKVDLQGLVFAYASLIIIILPLTLFAIPHIPGRPIIPEPGIGWRQEIRASLGLLSLILLLLVQFFGAFSFGALTSMLIFYADGYLGLAEKGAILLFSTFAGAALFTTLWIIMARRLGKPQTMILNCIWLVAIMVLGGFIPTRNFAGALVFAVFLGAGFMNLMLIQGMMSDLIPYDKIRCGRDRSGFLYAMLNLLQKMGNAVAVGLSYALLGAFDFDPKHPEQSAVLIRNIFVGLPALGWSCTMIVLFFLVRHGEVNAPSRGSSNLPLP
jgi:glycoside/pentoside/hexuronide:cation symporter, GPH family